MGKATTQIETRLTGVDATAAAFASVKRRFSAWDRSSALNKNLNPFAGFGKTNLAKGVAAGFEDVGKILGGVSYGVSSLATGLLGAATAAAAVGGAIAGFAAHKGLQTILGMDEFGDAAQKVGMTAGEFKKLNTVFEMIGIGGQELTENIIPKMNKALGEKAGQDALKKIGLSFEAIRTMSPEQRLKAIGAAISDISNDLDRAQLESDLFGKSGIQLDAIFRQGGKTFRDSFDKIGELTGRLDEGGVAAAGRFADAWQVANARAKTMWQNFVGDMLSKFEAKFGPIDVAMMGMFNKAAAEAKIWWLEIENNGPAVFTAFVSNVKLVVGQLPTFWSACMDVMWEDTIRLDKKVERRLAETMARTFLKIRGQAVNEELFKKAFDNVNTGPAQKRLDELKKNFADNWKKPDLVNLDDEKAKIRAAALEQTKKDADALKAKGDMEKGAANNMEGGLKRGAQAIKEALKDAEAMATGSYEAFKLSMNRGKVTSAQMTVPSVGPGAMAPSLLGGSDSGSGSMSAMVSQLSGLVTTLRDGARDRAVIRQTIEAIGVA